jgi:predicted nucleic acid-binding protein
MIFVDTSAWFAAAVPSDPNHSRADQYLGLVDPQLLITTDYILDETMTLLRVRGERRRTQEFGRRVLEERICRLVWVEKQDVAKAAILFESHPDKDWSFTDCVSRAVMERLKTDRIFGFDTHFREFGSVIVVP